MIKMKPKKAQTEIIGLIVIVLLLAALSIVFVTLISRESPNTTSIIRTSTKADNLLNSIIRTTTPEGKFMDLVSECNTKGDFSTLKREISSILAKTIPKNRQSSLKLLINQQEVFSLGACDIGVASTKTIKNKEDTIKLNLKLC